MRARAPAWRRLPAAWPLVGSRDPHAIPHPAVTGPDGGERAAFRAIGVRLWTASVPF